MKMNKKMQQMYTFRLKGLQYVNDKNFKNIILSKKGAGIINTHRRSIDENDIIKEKILQIKHQA